jgi:hypothetical protein
MPQTYFEPENLKALVEVFHEAKRILQRRGSADPVMLDWTARRILNLAAQGLPPSVILAEILPPITPEAAGLPAHPGADEIIVQGRSGGKLEVVQDMPEGGKILQLDIIASLSLESPRPKLRESREKNVPSYQSSGIFSTGPPSRIRTAGPALLTGYRGQPTDSKGRL